jgi:hypothetical protein
VVLSTKFGIPSSRLGARIPGWNYGAMAGRLVKRLLGRNRGSKLPPRDFSARRAQSSVEDSLRALQTDYIDVFHLHEPTLDLLGDAEHLARALEQLKAAGKVRYVGLSGRAAACASIARRQPRLAEVLQLEAPAGADGLPDAIEADTAAAVTFWEFAPGTAPAGLVRATVERLLAAAPQSVTLVSTNSEANLRAAVAILNNLHAAAPPSATSSLA